MKLIEVAWLEYVEKVIPPDAPAIQFKECRKAFYAGAGTLFSSIMNVLGPGQEATESDLLIMDGINEELQQFLKEAQRRES